MRMSTIRQKLKLYANEQRKEKQIEQQAIINTLQQQYKDIHRTKVHIIKTLTLQEKQIMHEIEAAKKCMNELKALH